MLRSLRVLMVLLVASLSLVLTSNAPAFACTCAMQTEKQWADRADVVFVGTVDRIDDANRRRLTYEITATHGYKGTVQHETSVVSAAMSAACGLGGIKVGKDYIFFATGTAAPYRANLCGGTGKATTKRIDKVVAVIGAGTEITPPPPPTATRVHVEESRPDGFTRTAAPGAAAIVVGLLGLLLLRIRTGKRR